VIECMALQPLLQSLCELKLIKETHGVLTNARPDHLDVMGPTERYVAKALAATIPVGDKYFTAEDIHLDFFEYACKDRGS
ncbi:poly-gamma-glutamate synthase PgsB, partial [Francisella tularensis subsp. holarctica]|nr:poly-gamma-glutamate synthase PgsB [Francisella tularensis subsp. holarctica]